MPSKVRTLAEDRTEVGLICSRCRYEWSIEMSPPVLIMKPDREVDDQSGDSQPAVHNDARNGDRRRPQPFQRPRMRVGLSGLLTSTDRMHTITVLYSVNSHRSTGRLRLISRTTVWPQWLVPGSRLWLSSYDGLRLRIRITAVKLRCGGSEDDDCAEFVVPHL
jgi:hypothetical protein